jgi:hypothetical protein
VQDRNRHEQFLLGMVLAIYIGSSRLNHLHYIAQAPMLAGFYKLRSCRPSVRSGSFWRCCIRWCAAVVDGAAGHATMGVGCRPRAVDQDHLGHRYHRVYPLTVVSSAHGKATTRRIGARASTSSRRLTYKRHARYLSTEDIQQN